MTFTTVKIRNNNDAQVIISDLKNKYFTLFPATSNINTIFVGDSTISFNNKKGLPLSTLSDTIALFYLNKIYVTDSNHWYISGLQDDQVYVLIEDNPIDVWMNLITSLLTQILDKTK